MQCRTVTGSFTPQMSPEDEMDDTSLLLERLSNADTPHDMNVALAEFLQVIGVERFAYIAPNPTSSRHRTWYVTNYEEEWTSRYAEQNYLAWDPLYQMARTSRMPISYSAQQLGKSNCKKEKEILFLADDFGMGNWLAAPVHGHGGEFASLIAAFPRGASNLSIPSKNLFFLGALYFHHALWNRLNAGHTPQRRRLSSQQVEILAWAATGKSKWDISDILTKPQDLIRQEVAKAGQALGTFNLTSTIAKAYALGYLKR